MVVETDVREPSAPLYVGYAGSDDMVSPTLVQDLNGWLQEKKVPFRHRVYPEMPHGFAARPDLDNVNVREQYLEAFKETLEFLKLHA